MVAEQKPLSPDMQVTAWVGEISGKLHNHNSMALRVSILAVATGVGLFASPPTVDAQGKVLEVVKQRGSLSCGVHIGLAGFGQPDDKGNWTGLDVDYCRAIAAAIFADDKKVKFVPTTAKERFTALQSGEGGRYFIVLKTLKSKWMRWGELSFAAVEPGELELNGQVSLNGWNLGNSNSTGKCRSTVVNDCRKRASASAI